MVMIVYSNKDDMTDEVKKCHFISMMWLNMCRCKNHNMNINYSSFPNGGSYDDNGSNNDNSHYDGDNEMK